MILKATNIHKSYKHAGSFLHVLKDIDLNIAQGEALAIVGPSGVGKSTLLHILGGLDVPDEGTVILEDEDIYRLRDKARAKVRNRKIGFVFQFYHLLPEFTALENVLLPAFIKGGREGMKVFREKAAALLEQVGLKERGTHKPYQLSGGEQQRVAIARALINEPKIILCDEPTGNLDSNSGNEIIELLMRLNATNHQTLVIVTHDQKIAQLNHRTICMRDGELV